MGAGLAVLWDDRKERPGVMFADMDLIGIPNRIVVSDRGLDQGTVEYKARRSGDVQNIPIDRVVGEMKNTVTINPPQPSFFKGGGN